MGEWAIRRVLAVVAAIALTVGGMAVSGRVTAQDTTTEPELTTSVIERATTDSLFKFGEDEDGTGDLLVIGPLMDEGESALAVIGGTGGYAGAFGEMVTRDYHDGIQKCQSFITLM